MHTCFDCVYVNLIDAGDLGDDAANGGDCFTVRIDDGEGGVAVLLQAVEYIRTDGGAFASGEDEDLPRDGLAFQVVAGFGDNTGFRVNAAIKGNPHTADEGLAGCLAGEDGADR